MVRAERRVGSPRCLVAALVCVVIAPGCTSLPAPAPLAIDELVFLNEAGSAVSKLSLRIEATRELVACGYLPVRGECSTTFALRAYRGNAVRLACTQGARSLRSAPFVMSPPPAPIAGRPARAPVILRDAGEFSARLVP